jgi:subtilase family serine protease
VGKQVITLVTGASTTVSFTWKPTTTGSHDLQVVADPTNSIAEISETNNQQTSTLNVVDLRPDLTVTNITTLSNLSAGNSYPVVADISNNGATAATFTVRFYDNGVCVGKQTMYLAAGSNNKVLFAWKPSSAGSHDLMVIVDSANSIAETNEANNQQVSTVSVT